MTVDTKTVSGRRTLTFHSLDEVVADAEKLVSASHTKMLGNWPLSQLLTHLTSAINHSIDGIDRRAPWYYRIFGKLIKNRILTKGMEPGFQLPKEVESNFFPVASEQEALEKLRSAVGRLRIETMTAKHPVFGQLTHDEWNRLHLRHAELHLSFAVPG